MNNKINTVVFDLDGTLLDTLQDLRDAANHTFEKYSIPQITLEQTKNAVGNGLTVMMKRAIPQGEAHPQFNNILADFVDYYKSHACVKTKPYDGITDSIKKFAENGYKLAIVSNKPDISVVELTKYFFGEFDIVASGENEKAGIPKKPSPEMVFTALKRLGAEATDAVYVGDSDVDILTAQNSGMPCVSVSWGFKTREQLVSFGAKKIIDSPADLYDAVNDMV